MILTGKGHLEANIGPETVDQTKSIEDIMRRIGSKKVYY